LNKYAKIQFLHSFRKLTFSENLYILWLLIKSMALMQEHGNRDKANRVQAVSKDEYTSLTDFIRQNQGKPFFLPQSDTEFFVRISV